MGVAGYQHGLQRMVFLYVGNVDLLSDLQKATATSAAVFSDICVVMDGDWLRACHVVVLSRSLLR